MKLRFLFPLLLGLSLTLTTHAEEPDTLEYRLSYSGLFTGFMWKELADVSLSLTPEPTQFREQEARKIGMFVNTANYGFAEAMYPLRYHWESVLSPDLQYTRLVTIIDEGSNDRHEVAWYRWDKKVTNLYRKRRQVDVGIPIFDEKPVLAWEQDTLTPAPAFIDNHEPVAPGQGYLLHTEHHSNHLSDPAIDPLAMLLALTRHDFNTAPKLAMHILLDSDLAPYHAELVSREPLERGECSDQALKIEVKRSNETGEEGYMQVWLSDDPQRTLLRLDVDAPLGKIHVVLKKGSRCGTEGS